MKKTVLILTSITVLLVLTLFMMYSNVNNTEIELRANVEAHQKECESNRDKLHNTLSMMAEVPSEFMEKSKEAFLEIYPKLMEGRYGNERGGALMSWVVESNPNFDMNAAKDLYENLQIAIESNYKEFDNKQVALIDAQREHHVFIHRTLNDILWNLDERGDVDIVLLESKKVSEEYSNGGSYEMETLFKK